MFETFCYYFWYWIVLKTPALHSQPKNAFAKLKYILSAECLLPGYILIYHMEFHPVTNQIGGRGGVLINQKELYSVINLTGGGEEKGKEGWGELNLLARLRFINDLLPGIHSSPFSDSTGSVNGLTASRMSGVYGRKKKNKQFGIYHLQ